jgi:hypothetical protein
VVLPAKIDEYTNMRSGGGADGIWFLKVEPVRYFFLSELATLA